MQSDFPEANIPWRDHFPNCYVFVAVNERDPPQELNGFLPKLFIKVF